MLRTKEQIQLFLNKTKQQKLKEKQRQKLKYKKAQEATKKQLKHKTSTNIKQTPEKPLKYTYSLTIYQSPLIERFPDENELYQTREEIDNDDSGSINWEVLDKIIERLRKNL